MSTYYKCDICDEFCDHQDKIRDTFSTDKFSEFNRTSVISPLDHPQYDFNVDVAFVFHSTCEHICHSCRLNLISSAYEILLPPSDKCTLPDVQT